MFNLLKGLVKAFGVSGMENGVASVIENELQGVVASMRKDAMGNLIAVQKIGNSPNPQRVLLAAHMDTIGVIATHVDDNGYIRFSNVGGLKPYALAGQTVEFSSGVRGVISVDASVTDVKDVKISGMFIDTGLSDKEEIQKKVPIGSCGRFVFATYQQGDTAISGYLDDRAGCAVLIQTAKAIAESKAKGELMADKEIYYVFTAQEEVGLRGAGPATYDINPHLAIVVDVTHAQDVPGSKASNVKMGGGPVITIKDCKSISHPYIRQRLKDMALQLEIPYQITIEEKGGTDAGAIHMALGGIVTGGLSIPVRYMHTPTEMCSLRDLSQTVSILTEFLKIEK